MVEERWQQNNGRKPDKIATIQTTAGRYEARLTEDNANDWPIRRMTQLPRYIISGPPRMMRNIPKYYATEKPRDSQVLKFDVRHPDPDRHRRNRRKESSELADRECVIEHMEQIQEKRNKPSIRTWTRWKEHYKKTTGKETYKKICTRWNRTKQQTKNRQKQTETGKKEPKLKRRHDSGKKREEEYAKKWCRNKGKHTTNRTSHDGTPIVNVARKMHIREKGAQTTPTNDMGEFS